MVLGFPISLLGMVVLNAKLGTGCESAEDSSGWVGFQLKHTHIKNLKCFRNDSQVAWSSSKLISKKLKQPYQTFNCNKKAG